MTTYSSNLPEVQYELKDDGMIYAVNPAEAKTDHIIVYENRTLAIVRVGPPMSLDATRERGCAIK